MARGTQRCRVDGNHTEVVKALNNAGMKVQSLASIGKGCPDLLVGFRGLNIALEVKDGARPPSGRLLTSDERDWQDTWPGFVMTVTSAEDAINAVVAHAKLWGAL